MQRWNAISLSKDSVGISLGRGLSGRAVTRFVVIASSLVVALSGCSPTKRTFGEGSAATDAGSTHNEGPDGGGVVDTDTEGTGTSNAGNSNAGTSNAGTSNESGEAGSSDATSGTDTSEETGTLCSATAASCPAGTECRTYAVSGCDETGKPICDATNVDTDTPCADGAGQCDGKGQCVLPDRALLGEACEEDAECGSDHCVAGQDGAKLCCDAACDGVCTACGTDGHCDVTPAEDAECGEITCSESDECTVYPPNRAACAGFGACETTQSYCEPEFTTASCNGGGTCDGSGNCCPKPGRERQCTKECPCGTGEGVCSNNDQCLTGYVCTADAKAKLGFPAASCLPAHCVNDVMDEGETSVDCGAGCGCRATYEVVQINSVLQGAQVSLVAMSGDGSTFAAILDRGRPLYPARVSADGALTELQATGSTGRPNAINADGSVIVGSATCSEPVCSYVYDRPVRWVNNNPPEVLADSSGAAEAVSGTGQYVAYKVVEGAYRVNMESNGTSALPELNYIAGMSADGNRIAGGASSVTKGVLWAPGGTVSLNPPADWSSWAINALSSDGKVFVGTASKEGVQNTVSFIWKDGQFTQLPVLPGATGNSIGGLSADGKVVVGYTSVGAFIWDALSNEIRTVVAEARARGLELPADLVLVYDPMVSDDGRIIVGQDPWADIPHSFWRVTLLPDGEWLP
jgi:hypothetical protein